MRERGYVKNLAVALIAMLVICYGMYAMFQSPIGLAYEKNRVHHPAGFSIIVPPKWDSQIQNAAKDGAKNAIIMTPQKADNWRGGASVLQWATIPDDAKMIADKYEPTTYHSQAGWRKESHTLKAKRVSIVFQSDGGWYEFKFERPLSEPIESWWKEFMNSFKVDAPTTPRSSVPEINIALPTSAPSSTLPATSESQ